MPTAQPPAAPQASQPTAVIPIGAVALEKAAETVQQRWERVAELEKQIASLVLFSSDPRAVTGHADAGRHPLLQLAIEQRDVYQKQQSVVNDCVRELQNTVGTMQRRAAAMTPGPDAPAMTAEAIKETKDAVVGLARMMGMLVADIDRGSLAQAKQLELIGKTMGAALRDVAAQSQLQVKALVDAAKMQQAERIEWIRRAAARGGGMGLTTGGLLAAQRAAAGYKPPRPEWDAAGAGPDAGPDTPPAADTGATP